MKDFFLGGISMKLEQNEESLLFGKTEIPDVFFTEYISSASGDFIKVYLYLVFLSKHNKEIKLTDLSKILSLEFKVMQSACTYWENLGVITRRTTGYIITNLQEVELNKLYKPKLSISAKDLEKNAKNEYRAKAIENINSLYFQGMMSPAWYNDINLWFVKYGFDEQVMLALINYCFDKSALHKNYVQTVADAWSKNKVKTYTDLENYLEKQEKFNILKKDIIKKLRLHRDLSQFEEAYIEKWTTDFCYSADIIDIALRKTTSKSNPTFDYINKLLTDWNSHGLKNANDILSYMEDSKNKNHSVKELEKKSKFNSYEQRKYNNLDTMYYDFNQSSGNTNP